MFLINFIFHCVLIYDLNLNLFFILKFNNFFCTFKNTMRILATCFYFHKEKQKKKISCNFFLVPRRMAHSRKRSKRER